jgi:hypothetical protein
VSSSIPLSVLCVHPSSPRDRSHRMMPEHESLRGLPAGKGWQECVNHYYHPDTVTAHT